MINHSDAAELLPWYVNGTLRGREREAVKTHLDQCPDCRAEIAEWTVLRQAVEEETHGIPSPRKGLFEEILRQVDPGSPEQGRLAKIRRKPFLSWLLHPAPAWAVCGLLLAVLGYQVYRPQPAMVFPVSAKLSEARAGDLVRLPPGERFLHLEVYVYPEGSFDKLRCRLKLGGKIIDSVDAPGSQEPLDLVFSASSLKEGDYSLAISGVREKAPGTPKEIRSIAFHLQR